MSQLAGFRIPPATFYRWLDEGIIPASKFVRRWLVRPEAVRQFVKENSW